MNKIISILVLLEFPILSFASGLSLCNQYPLFTQNIFYQMSTNERVDSIIFLDKNQKEIWDYNTNDILVTRIDSNQSTISSSTYTRNSPTLVTLTSGSLTSTQNSINDTSSTANFNGNTRIYKYGFSLFELTFEDGIKDSMIQSNDSVKIFRGILPGLGCNTCALTTCTYTEYSCICDSTKIIYPGNFIYRESQGSRIIDTYVRYTLSTHNNDTTTIIYKSKFNWGQIPVRLIRTTNSKTNTKMPIEYYDLLGKKAPNNR